MELTDDDVLEILKLFEQSKFDFLHLEHGDRKITISKPGYVPPAAGVVAPSTAPGHFPTPPSAPTTGPDTKAARSEPVAIDEGLVAIPAPIVGKFYSAPSPNDPPFVTIGDRVTVDATLGLIEVMKVFTSIKSTVTGVVERILVSNGTAVEYGQALFLIRPDGK
jgi:acetyl-CoA carboxylase biotin carboxyl carrier protein